MLIATVALLLSVLAIAPARDAAGSTAKDAANRFYRAYLKLNPRGLPTDEEMKTFAPLFSRELIDAISNASRVQAKFIHEHPDEKPPWIEGNLFASLYEGVSYFSLGAPTFNDDKASIPVYLEYREKKTVTRWIDVLILQREGKEWRVWDIFLNAPWSFRSGPSLRALLSPD
jgi:hypothetical protein